jgi:hypothetical protein
VQIVFVGKFLKRIDRGGGDHRFTNVFIKNLPDDVDDAGLKTIAEEFGEVRGRGWRGGGGLARRGGRGRGWGEGAEVDWL